MKATAFERLTPEQAQRSRKAVRGCRNCLYLDADTQHCHYDRPKDGVFEATPERGWCGRWRDARNPRMSWDASLSGVELDQLNDQGELLCLSPAQLRASFAGPEAG